MSILRGPFYVMDRAAYLVRTFEAICDRVTEWKDPQFNAVGKDGSRGKLHILGCVHSSTNARRGETA